MATFFGEVLSVYSRAVEEDEYDDENEEDEQIRREIEKKRWNHVSYLFIKYWTESVSSISDEVFVSFIRVCSVLPLSVQLRVFLMLCIDHVMLIIYIPIEYIYSWIISNCL